MLKAHTGSIWIGTKVAEKVKDRDQSLKRKNIFVRLALDKVNPIEITYIFFGEM